jgi:hypothetical protein
VEAAKKEDGIFQGESGMTSKGALNLDPEKSKRQTPWWYYGLQLIFICLMVVQGGWREHDYFHWFFMGACVLFMLVLFIRQFIKQQAQYSIKAMMIATFVVAVFCSIYSCFGPNVFFHSILIVYVIVLLCVGNRTSEGGNERRSSPADQDGAD